MKSYSIYINGEKAIQAAKNIIGDKCYKNIEDIGQFEIVLNSDKIYNGYIQKWVSVAYIKTLDILNTKTIEYLKNHGFNGCVAEIIEENIPENSCFINQKVLKTITI